MDATERADTTILVAGICGSLRKGSYTRMAVNVALRGAAEAGAQTQLVDLVEYGLGFAGIGDGSEPEGVATMRKLVKAADGIILGTPEYHGSFSGVLKNALDLMGFAEFEGKMMGLVGVSGGKMGAFDALNSLRNIGRALHAWVVPEQGSVPEAWKAFAEGGGLKDGEMQDRLLTVGRQVARFARLHKCAEATEFLKRWETAPVNPGGE
jgi:NAD(P)H-dependent FMN reductase